MPSYNQAKFLPAALESILNQKTENGSKNIEYELFVQDGGSNDESVEILKAYEGKFGGRMKWTSARDGGQTAAINEGLKKTSGEILCYLNSDDVLVAEAFENVIEVFEKNTSASFIYGRAEIIDETGGKVKNYEVKDFDSEDLFYKELLKTCFICQPACFWRRSVYEKLGGFDEKLKYNMDYEYWLRSAKSGEEFIFADDVLAQSRWHNETKTKSGRLNLHQEALKMLENYSPKNRPNVRWLRGTCEAFGEEYAMIKEGTSNKEEKTKFLIYARGYLEGLKGLCAQYNISAWESLYIVVRVFKGYERWIKQYIGAIRS